MQRGSDELIVISINRNTTNPVYRKLTMPDVPTDKLTIIVQELEKAASLRQSHLILIRAVMDIADGLEKEGHKDAPALLRLAVSNAHDRHEEIESNDAKGTE